MSDILKKLGFSSRGATRQSPPQPPQPPNTRPIDANPQPYPHDVPLGRPLGPQIIPPSIGIPPQYPPHYGLSLRELQTLQAPAAPAELPGLRRIRKPQLIVGVHFVSSFVTSTLRCTADQRQQGADFSGVAFAFATHQEAKADIITEWPAAGNVTLKTQKVWF